MAEPTTTIVQRVGDVVVERHSEAPREFTNFGYRVYYCHQCAAMLTPGDEPPQSAATTSSKKRSFLARLRGTRRRKRASSFDGTTTTSSLITSTSSSSNDEHEPPTASSTAPPANLRFHSWADGYNLCHRCYTELGRPPLWYSELCEATGFGTETVAPCVRSLLVRALAKRFVNRPCLGVRVRDADLARLDATVRETRILSGYRWHTYAEVHELVMRLALHPSVRSLPSGSCVAVCGRPSIEYVEVLLMLFYRRLVAVPVHHSLSSAHLHHILAEIKAPIIFCQLEFATAMLEQAAKVRVQQQQATADNVTSTSTSTILTATTFVIMDDHDGSHSAEWPNDMAAAHGVRLVEWQQFLSESDAAACAAASHDGTLSPRQQLELEFAQPVPEDELVTVIYTSGSTNNPKGVQLFNGNIFAELYRPDFEPEQASRYCYRPLSHATEWRETIAAIGVGRRIGFASWYGSERTSLYRMFEEIALVSPTLFSAVPRVWSVLHSIFRSEVAVLLHERPTLTPAEAEAAVSRDFAQRMLGSNVRRVVYGGAVTDRELDRWIHRTFPMAAQGYGASEVGAIASEGHLLSSISYKLRPVPELGYTLEDKPYPRGELLVKTLRIRKQGHTYFGAAANNAAGRDGDGGDSEQQQVASVVDEDGWHHTGDIVELRPGEQVLVIDRCKNNFKLGQSEFVSPQVIEGLVQAHCHVAEQVYVHTKVGKSYIVVVIVPKADALCTLLAATSKPKAELSDVVRAWLERTQQTLFERHAQLAVDPLRSSASGIVQPPPLFDDAVPQEVCDDDFVRQLVLGEAVRAIRAAERPPYEEPRYCYLHSEPFSTDNTLMVTSGKINRPALIRFFQPILDPIYDKIDAALGGGSMSTAAAHDAGDGPSSLTDSRILTPAAFTIDEIAQVVEQLLRLVVNCTSDAHHLPVDLVRDGVDSLAVIQLRALLQRRFPASPIPSLPYILKHPTALGIAHYLQGGSAPEQQQQHQQQPDEQAPQQRPSPNELAKQDLETLAQSLSSTTPRSPVKRVLLTGATGFLGKFVLHSLLHSANTDCHHRSSIHRIYCIVRASNDAAAAQRLSHTLRHAHLDATRGSVWQLMNHSELDDHDRDGGDNVEAAPSSDDASERSGAGAPMIRVYAWAGDASQPAFGLSLRRYRRLLTSVQAVFHVAARVNHMLPYTLLRDDNVLGTLSIVRLCCGQLDPRLAPLLESDSAEAGKFAHLTPQPKHLHYASTLSVRGGIDASSGYGLSKFVAESLVRQVASRGLSATIHRFGYIGFDSSTGVCSASDYVCQVIAAVARSAFAPPLEATTPNHTIVYLPVDLAAAHYVTLALAHERGERFVDDGMAAGTAPIFTHTGRTSTLWSTVIEAIRFGGAAQGSSASHWSCRWSGAQRTSDATNAKLWLASMIDACPLLQYHLECAGVIKLDDPSHRVDYARVLPIKRLQTCAFTDRALGQCEPDMDSQAESHVPLEAVRDLLLPAMVHEGLVALDA